MTFEILVSMYVGALLVYVPYVLTKVVRTRREHDRLRKEFIMQHPNHEYWNKGGEDNE